MSHPNRIRVENMLRDFGGFYTFADVMERIHDGRFQSFAHGDSWAVTQVCEFPQKKVLDIVFIVGSLKELEIVYSDILGFVAEQGITYGMANGRRGFIEKAFPGWKFVSATFVKDFNDGT